MYKSLLLIGIAMQLFVQMASAGNFAPEPLKISAPALMLYEFDNSTMKMPVQVSGPPATALLVIFTKDQASQIRNVRNGHLGWHYMNRVDTCMYISAPFRLQPGQNTVPWDGRDENGTKMSRRDYTYYLWAYADSSQYGEIACPFRFSRFDRSFLQTRDNTGSPLAKPVLYSSAAPLEFTGLTWNTRSRWIIGEDTSNNTLVETTRYQSWPDGGRLALDFHDDSCFFTQSLAPGELVLAKWKWIPNGDAELQPPWGDNGYFRHSTLLDSNNPLYSGPVVDSYTEYLFYTDTFSQDSEEKRGIVYVDPSDGTEIKRIDLSSWWADTQNNTAGPSALSFSQGSLFLNSPWACTALMIYPYAEDESSLIQWVNGNCDTFGDKYPESGSSTPRVSTGLDQPPHAGQFAVDGQRFAGFPVEGLDMVSFGLFTPDGTGAGYFPLPGLENGTVYGLQVADYGSAYDGLYYGGVSANGDSTGIRYTAYTVFKGMIWEGCTWTPFIPYIRAPVQNELVRAGALYTIVWEGFADSPCVLEFSPDGGATWTTISDSTAVNKFAWTVPNIESVNCMLRVIRMDISDYPILSPRFTISGPTGIDAASSPRPFITTANFPNPFNPATAIRYTLGRPGRVTLTVYNALGQLVRREDLGRMEAGAHEYRFESAGLTSGVYLYRVETEMAAVTGKMLLMR